MKSSFLVACLSLSVALSACTTNTETAPLNFTNSWESNVSSMVGNPGKERASLSDGYAPDFRWHRSDGSLDSLSAHKGKIVVLNFWATWCGYCKNEMPALKEIGNELSDTIDVIGVSTDNVGDVFQTVRSYVTSNPYSYQFVIDSNYTLYNRYLLYSTTGIPQTFIIDRNGRARFNLPGEQPKSTFLKYIRSLE